MRVTPEAGEAVPTGARLAHRIPELDGLRGLAAIAVVLLHAFPEGPFFWGWSGVDLFFVLSGYLITRIILLQSGSTGFLRSFYLRRIFRIWPVYYLTMTGVLVVNHYSVNGFAVAGLPNYLFFVQNCQKYFGWPVPMFVGQFYASWSVAVEEQYYLLWPLLIMLCKPRSIPFFSVALLVMSLVGRTLLPDTYELLGTRADGLGLGCFLAWMLETPHPSFTPGVTRRVLWASGVPAAIYVTVYLFRWSAEPQGWFVTRYTAFSFLAFAVVGLCILHSGHRLLAPFRWPILRGFGTISYALYLFHYPILSYAHEILGRLGVHPRGPQTALMWVLIVAMPTASWFLLEKPILRFTKNWLAGHALPKATGQEEAAVALPRG